MGHSSWQIYSCQMFKIICTLPRNLKGSAKDSKTDPIINRIKPVHNRSFCLSKICFNNILQATPKPSKRSILFTFFQNWYCVHISHLSAFVQHVGPFYPWLRHPDDVWCKIQTRNFPLQISSSFMLLSTFQIQKHSWSHLAELLWAHSTK